MCFVHTINSNCVYCSRFFNSFDVCDVSDTDMTTESDTFDSDNDDDEDNQIVGNDSFEYNKSMLWKRVNFQGSGKGFESVPTLPEYESFFRTENDFLTSTAVDESGSSFVDDNVDRSVDPQIQTADGQILAKIKSIESKVSSFFEFIRNELNDVKGLVLRDIGIASARTFQRLNFNYFRFYRQKKTTAIR